MSDIHRLVYTSRNLLQGTDEERVAIVAQILATSQRNNGKVGVTGALLFNSGCFAQVLEGPRVAVEATFERIQRDPRHGDVSVLQCEPVESRGFPNWSMAFIGHSVRGRALWSEIAGRTGFDLSRIEGEQLFATLHRIVVEEEGIASDASFTADPHPGSTRPGGDGLDAERLRSELRDRMPRECRAAPGERTGMEGVAEPGRPTAVVRKAGYAGNGSDFAILKAALAEERERTTSLRRSLDETRIALAAMSDEIEVLRRNRDVWAGRAKALATALVQEPTRAEAFRTAALDEDGHGSAQPVTRAVVGSSIPPHPTISTTPLASR